MSKLSKEELNPTLRASVEAGASAATGLATHVGDGKHITSVGSNVNGQWIAFDSGILICTHTISKAIPSADGKIAGTWISPYPYADGLPRPYFDVNVSYNYYYGDTDVPQNRVIKKVTGGLTSMLLNYVLEFEASSSPYEKDISFMLMGRWK